MGKSWWNHKSNLSSIIKQLADYPNVAEELADIVYVIYGTAHAYGIDLDSVLKEIHKANMKKMWPDGKKRTVSEGDLMGKILKPPSWKKADIKKLLKTK